MRLLTRHILREIAMPALLALAVVSFVAVASKVHEQTRDVSLAYATPADMARLVLYLLPTLVSYVLAITYMMGVLMGFGRMAQDGEVVAMQAAGIPLKRVVLPVFVCGLALSALCFLLQDRVQPWAAERMFRLLGEELPRRRGLDMLPAGVMHDFHDWRVYIGRRDADTGAWRDVEILDDRGWAYYASSAELLRRDGVPYLVLKDGHLIMPSVDGRLGLSPFARWEVQVPRVDARDLDGGSLALSLGALFHLEQRLSEELRTAESVGLRSRLASVRQDISERVSLPFACFAVAFVAAPLGVRARRSGRSYTFAVGFVVVLAYYLLHVLAQPRSLSPLAEVVARGQAANVVLLAAGAFFLWRVDRV